MKCIKSIVLLVLAGLVICMFLYGIDGSKWEDNVKVSFVVWCIFSTFMSVGYSILLDDPDDNYEN